MPIMINKRMMNDERVALFRFRTIYWQGLPAAGTDTEMASLGLSHAVSGLLLLSRAVRAQLHYSFSVLLRCFIVS